MIDLDSDAAAAPRDEVEAQVQRLVADAVALSNNLLAARSALQAIVSERERVLDNFAPVIGLLESAWTGKPEVVSAVECLRQLMENIKSIEFLPPMGG